MISQASHNFLSKKGCKFRHHEVEELEEREGQKKHKEHNLSYLADYGYPNDLT